MTQTTPRLMAGILVVALLTVTAGCMAVIGDDPDPERIANELQDRHEEIDDVQGVQVTVIETPNRTRRTVAELVERPPNQSRREIVETDSEWGSAGSVVVNDGETIRSYNAETNTVTEFELNRTPDSTQFANEELIADALNDSELSYEGTDTVAEHEVHVITLTDTGTNRTTTIWADQEFWYPLKYETTFDQGDQQLTTTMTYEEVAFNQGLNDDAFEFEPPANATVEEFEPPESQTVESAADVESATPYEFAEPDLPERFSFEEATVSDSGDSVTAFASYTADDETVQFTTTTTTDRELTGESVTVGDTQGTVTEFGDQIAVRWDCDGVRYSLSGELDRETLIDSAASVAC